MYRHAYIWRSDGIRLSCLWGDSSGGSEYILSSSRWVWALDFVSIYRLLCVDDHSFVAILSTNEAKLISFIIKNSKIIAKVDSIPLVNLMIGCISQKGHFGFDPTSNNLFYITSSNQIAYKRIGDNHTEELSQVSNVWRIVEYSPEALLYVDSSRSCLHYLDVQQQRDQELVNLVLTRSVVSCRMCQLMMFKLQTIGNILFLFQVPQIRLFFFHSQLLQCIMSFLHHVSIWVCLHVTSRL